MATQVPGADNQSSTEQGPQISGPESETSVSRHADLNLNLPTAIPTYNPYMLMQQMGPQSYPAYQIADSQQQHYDQQGHIPGSIHGTSLYTAPHEAHYAYQGYHPPVQEQMQGYPELQQQTYMQQAESFVQGDQSVYETSHQGSMQRILPRRLPHVRQRIRRRNRTNRAHISQIHSVAANIAYNNREHSTATSITGSVTSGPILTTPVELDGSQERLSRLTSTEESSGIGENFECNICFQKANEAVVTCCGHLFCWPCLYRWLHVHSYHKECPVCKGAIAEHSITPIYGRENALASAQMQGALGSERIPPRPAARRIESARQQREREEREREREIREAEARERSNQERAQVTEIEQAATELDQEESEQRAPGAEAPASADTSQRGEDLPQEGAETAARFQDSERDASHLDRESGDPTEHSQRDYLHRRLAFRREQLRQALANSRYSAAINQNPGARATERQQMLATTPLLSQEWEHTVNGTRLVVDPTQAGAWLASMHARLADLEGNMESTSDAAQQRLQMMASAVPQLSHQPQEESVTRMAVHPSQVSDWITTMRTRLNNIEQMMQNLERPIGQYQVPQPTNATELANRNSLQPADTAEGPNSNEFFAAAAPQEIVPDPVATLNVANENERSPETTVPEAHVVRRSRRRREHGEEASHVVAQEDNSTEAPREEPVPVTRKRRRRLD